MIGLVLAHPLDVQSDLDLGSLEESQCFGLFALFLEPFLSSFSGMAERGLGLLLSVVSLSI